MSEPYRQAEFGHEPLIEHVSHQSRPAPAIREDIQADLKEPDAHQRPEIPQDVAWELMAAWRATINYTNFKAVFPHVCSAVERLLAKVPGES